MSGFVVSRRSGAGCASIQRRGPDLTRTVEVEDFHFTHHLLRAAPEGAPQPLVDGELVCVCDGHFRERSGGRTGAEAAVALYRRHGEELARHLDGELAVAVYDFGRRVAVLATDPFATKPLFSRGAEAASHRGVLGGGERVPPNTVTVIGLDGGGRRRSVVEPFDFDHQEKEGYDDWIAAFEAAVARRAADGCYVPLSSGYDSGGIDCALARLGRPFKSFAVAGRENLDVVRRRNPEAEVLRMDEATFAEWEAYIRRHAETASFRVRIHKDNGGIEDYDVLDDDATAGLALIHSRARAEGRRIFLSGSGGDELLDGHDHGRWPRRLRPWPDFAARWGIAYLAKEEFAAGLFGAEARYPYLDRAVVQEFLWLTVELKNRFYRAPLHEYMSRCGYPFEEKVKRGFEPLPR